MEAAFRLSLVFRFTTFGGFSLVVDYGHDGDRMTPSLRAYRRHEQLANILEEPGCVDITADVDFGEWKSLFEGQCLMFGPVAQRRVEITLNTFDFFSFLRISSTFK